MKRMNNNPIPPIGAHFRMSASRLMFLAAFRYFADSDLREVERCDIPGRNKPKEEPKKVAHDLSYLPARADPPYSSS